MIGAMAMARTSALLRREVSVGDETNRWTISPEGSVSTLSGATAWVSIIDEVILASTILGAVSILGSMFFLEYKGRPATTRMRLVQSLVLSDLILGLIGIVGTSIVLSGDPLEAGSSTCHGLGFSLTAVLWTEHLWTLILAIATYMILIYPLHPVTIWLERRWYLLWILVWIWAVVIGLIGYVLFGYFPNGGMCYYGSNSGLYGELIQFIPRALVMVIITVLYARLFVFLRRPDRIRASFSSTDNAEMYDTSEVSRSRHRLRPRKLSGLLKGRKGSKESGSSEKGPLNEKTRGALAAPEGQDPLAQRHDSDIEGYEAGAHTPRRFRTITPPSTPDEPAPWEQVQLPIFHVDGERFGGRDGQGHGQGSNHGSGLHRETSSIWSGWKGLGKGDKQGTARSQRPSTASSTSPNMASASRIGSVSTTRDVPSSPRSLAQTTFPPTLEVDTPDLNEDADRLPHVPARMGSIDIAGPRERHGSTSSASFRGRVDQLRKQSAISAISSRLTEADEPSGYLSPVVAGGSLSGSLSSGPDQGRGKSLTSSEFVRRGSAFGSALALRRLSNERDKDGSTTGYTEPQPRGVRMIEPSAEDERHVQIRSALPAALAKSTRPAPPSRRNTGLSGRPEVQDSQSAGEAGEEEDENDWDLMRMLQASAVDDPGRRTQQDGGEEPVEFVEESMASYLNRKTALLMLWFPLGYVLLFSVSLVRIIYDFVGSPPVALRALSRWFIFSQGVLDAVIYGLVEWHTKRVVRKRVRKGTFNTPANSRSAHGAHGAGAGGGGGGGTGSALHAFRVFGQGSKQLLSSSSRNAYGTGSQIGMTSQGDIGSEKGNVAYSSSTPTASRAGSSFPTPVPLATPRVPDTRSIMQELEVDLSDHQQEQDAASHGSDSAGSGTRADSSTRKGSTGSELGATVVAVDYAQDTGDTELGDGDARARERRKD